MDVKSRLAGEVLGVNGEVVEGGRAAAMLDLGCVRVFEIVNGNV